VSDPLAIARAAALLRGATDVLFITGAGLSADSGLPTYRGIGGLYEGQLTDLGIPIEIALSGEMMATQPEICWRFIGEIERRCRGARPNRGHQVIAEMERVLPRVWTLTQNVEGLHEDAGSTNLIDIHGNVHHLICTRCRREQQVEDYAGLELPPICGCGGVIRPKVVLFGEMLPPDRVEILLAELERGFDVIVSVGTTSVFPYIAGPVVEAAEAGVPTIEINPGPTEVSALVDVKLAMGAAAALDALWTVLRAS
jgi:NAD-dependent deacetylase